MSNRPFRFVHASDFHLERVAAGMTEVPEHLRQALIDAPYRAAERVFDVAVNEQVDFVLLAGDILQVSSAGPRGLIFISTQMERLAERGIEVYWIGGRVDQLDNWPAALPLPETVHLISNDHPTHYVHHAAGEPVAQILAASGNGRRRIPTAEFRPDPGILYSIALAYGGADSDAMAREHIHYWALGGEHGRRTLLTTPVIAHYPGSPQGRRPRESGPHGCTLVQVDAERHARTSFVPTDTARWLNEKIPLTPAIAAEGLERLVQERAQALLGSHTGRELLVNWVVRGIGPLGYSLRRDKLAADLLERLRATFGRRHPGLWSIGLEYDANSAWPEGLPEEWYEQETMLGEYLRTVRQFENEPERTMELNHYLAERHVVGNVASAIELTDPATRARVLRDAALLGVDLLSPGEQQS